MVVWLRQDQQGIAVPDGIIRRDAWLKIGSLDASFLAIAEMRRSALEEVERQAQRIIDAAFEQAERIRQDAEEHALRLAEEAHARGRQAGVDEWSRALLASSLETHQQLRQQRERMARIVIGAVEKIVPLQDPQGIYRQVLRMLSKSMQAVRYVNVRVCPQELAFAESALRELAKGLALGKLIEVTSDDRLVRGACLVESDQGIVDLSLGSQLKALRTVIRSSVADGAADITDVADAPEEKATHG